DDVKGEHSVLVSEFLANLGKPGSAESVFNKTRLAISRASEGDQVPTVSSSLLEDVQFGATGG
ncbi:caspase family protein, partial [Herbaspirillum sp. HC18]